MIVLVEGVKTASDFQPLLVQLVDNDGFFGKEFWAAIVGAIFGGLIGIVGQLLSFRHERKMKEADRNEEQKAVGRSLLFKLLKMHSTASNVRKHIADWDRRGKADGITETWAAVPALANPGELISFSPAELALTSSLNEADLDRNVMGLDEYHNSLVDILNQYRMGRTELGRAMPNSHFDGSRGTAPLSDADLLRFKPDMLQLNSMIEGAAHISGEILSSSRMALIMLIGGLNAKFGTNMKFEEMSPRASGDEPFNNS
jgi:hypothetical protein